MISFRRWKNNSWNTRDGVLFIRSENVEREKSWSHKWYIFCWCAQKIVHISLIELTLRTCPTNKPINVFRVEKDLLRLSVFSCLEICSKLYLFTYCSKWLHKIGRCVYILVSDDIKTWSFLYLRHLAVRKKSDSKKR